MAEGPDVRLHVEFLDETLSGKILRGFVPLKGQYVTAIDPRFNDFRNDNAKLNTMISDNKKKIVIKEVKSKGKLMYMELQIHHFSTRWTAGKYVYILMQHGFWRESPSASTTFELHFSDDAGFVVQRLYMDDPRQQFRIDVVDADTLEQRLSSMGEDVLTPEFTLSGFVSAMRNNRESAVVDALVHQSVCAGVGNVYRCEALYLAKISPTRTIRSLSDAELEKIYAAVKFVTRKSYVEGGLDNYEPYVYGVAVDSERNPVASFSLRGRTIYWVPTIQK